MKIKELPLGNVSFFISELNGLSIEGEQWHYSFYEGDSETHIYLDFSIEEAKKLRDWLNKELK